MENRNGILKLEHLVKEIISAANIPFCKVQSVADHNVRAGEEDVLPVIQIVSYFNETQSRIPELLKEEFDLTEINSAGTTDGFTGTKQRYAATLKANRASLSEYKRFAGVKFEIQVGTVLSSALSGIVHSLGMGDPDSLSNAAKRDLFRVEALLETAEKELSKIREQYGSDAAAKQPGKPMAEPMKVDVVAPRRQVEAMPEQPKAAPAPKAEAAPIAAPPVAQKEAPIQPVQTAAAPPPPSPPPPAPEVKAAPQVSNNNGSTHRTQTGNIISTTVVPETIAAETYQQMSNTGGTMMEGIVPLSYASLREFVRGSRVLKEVDSQIAAHAGARLNDDIDIEGDVERLQFLEVFTLKQLHECIVENRADMVAFAEKWIGKDNGGTFDSGIGLFYLEYVLVAKKNDPTFATDYVLRYISDNDYSARYIIPTYNSLKLGEKQGSYSAMKG